MHIPIALLLSLLFVAASATSQNLLVSPDFDSASEIDDWPDPFPDPDTTLSWQSDLDVDGAPESGSLRIQNSISNGASDGPRQCVVTGPGFYEFEAFFFNITQTPQPAAVIFLEYYSSADCSGPAIGLDSNVGPATLDAWESVSLFEEAPAGTASIGVRITSGNTTDPTSHVLNYDAVYLPEPRTDWGLAVACLTLAALARRRAAARTRRSG